MSIIQGNSKTSAGGYTIDQSIRFNDNDSARLYSTSFSASPTSTTTCTFSTWAKRANLGGNQVIFYGGNPAGSTYELLRFDNTNSDCLRLSQASSAYVLVSTAVFRDPSAWYHIVAVWDTSNATSGDRIRIYVNGSRITSFSTATYPSLNYATNMTAGGASIEHVLGANSNSGPASQFLDGYQAEVYFIDGQALDPSYFGEVNADTGQWIAKRYGGSYGSNGFYITGENSAALGADYSGNSNNFTSSGLTSADQRTDTPTNNHCTFNPLWIDTYTLSDGNLVTSTGADASALGTMAVDATDSDGWYWEMKVTTAATYPGVGIILASQASLVANTALSGTNTNRYYFQWDGNFNNQGSAGAYGSSWGGTANKVIGVYLKGGALWFSIDGVVQNSGDPSTASTGAAITGLTGDFYPVVIYAAGSGTQAAWTAQFAEADWGTTPPAGYKALSTAALPDPTIADPGQYFNTVLFTGNSGTAFSVTGVGFQPDWVWGKPRSYADNHRLMDVVRGSTKQILTNTSQAEFTQTQGITSFDSDGFTVGTHNGLNTGTNTYVAWCWLADNTTGSSNTDGSITSTVSANTTSGFSIATYTGNATVGATVGHGLGVAPKMVIVKTRSNSENWVVGHDSMGWTKGIYLNSTSAAFTLDIYWNNTAPTSSVVELHDHPVTNGSGYTYVMYSFAEVEGFSKFGSYKGNGSSNGTFIYTGFRPAFVLWKNSSTSGTDWYIKDTARDTYNVMTKRIYPNANYAEDPNTSNDLIDMLSNGFKIRSSGNAATNGSGNTIIYAAFAGTPFKTATAR